MLNGYFTFNFGRLSIPVSTLLDGAGHLPSVTLRLSISMVDCRQSRKEQKVVGKETLTFPKQSLCLLLSASYLEHI